MFMPTAAQAAIPQFAGAALQQTGIEFKVVATANGYAVYARPNATPGEGGQTLTAQITMRVPHATGDERFEISNLQTSVDGVFWWQRSRVDAPSEDPDGDYISFEFDYLLSNLGAMQWVADQEIELFTFENSGAAVGNIGLMETCSDFMAPNSTNTNPGNQIAVRGLDINNAYIGNYGVTVATTCVTDIFMPLITR
ncbi:MAG: hypothetical protein R3A44_06065 [Caldilineaceae bacterium]